MVHVPDLLGCVKVGPTTEEAVEAAPEEIRAYLSFLRRHGEDADPESEFRTAVAEHITEGQWLGNGDPTITFASDRKPPGPRTVARAAERFRWHRAETLDLVGGLSAANLQARPASGDRPLGQIVHHVLDASRGYLMTLGSQPELNALTREVEKGDASPVEALRGSTELIAERVAAMTPEERAISIQRGRDRWLWNATKFLRRTLEHEWEHLREIQRRLAVSA